MMKELFNIYKEIIEDKLGDDVRRRFEKYFGMEENANSKELRKLVESKYFIKN